MAHLDIIPTTVEVFGHGGAFEIQDYLGPGPYEEETSDTSALMAKASEAFKKSDFSEAIVLFNRVLSINPFHTVALNNRAAAQQNLGDYVSAVDSVSEALLIEPNYLPYYRAYIGLARRCGYLRACRARFETMKSRFYITSSDYELGINVYLSSGNPEKAKLLFEELVKQLNSSDKSVENLGETIETELSSKKRALALIEQSEGDIPAGKSMRVEILQEAFSIYDRDSFLRINLGLALQRVERFEEATQLLLSSVNTVPSSMIKVCLANAAFCAVRLSSIEKAIGLLESTMDVVAEEYGDDHAIDPWLAPGVTLWVSREGAVLEELPESALRIVELAIRDYSREGRSVPDRVKLLAELYREACESTNSP